MIGFMFETRKTALLVGTPSCASASSLAQDEDVSPVCRSAMQKSD